MYLSDPQLGVTNCMTYKGQEIKLLKKKNKFKNKKDILLETLRNSALKMAVDPISIK